MVNNHLIYGILVNYRATMASFFSDDHRRNNLPEQYPEGFVYNSANENISSTVLIKENLQADIHIVTAIRHLTENTFILRFTRGNMQFRAGQHLIAGIHGEMDQREYSIYSGENDPFLEILIREVKGGNISSKLGQSKPGDILNINGPFGSFGIPPRARNTGNLIFIATGTGISPFHSMVRSYPGIEYTLLHGIRFMKETYESDTYAPGRYITCPSQETFNGRKGRVTRYLADFRLTQEMLFFLCGNSSMIYEVRHILEARGVASEKIFTEVYF